MLADVKEFPTFRDGAALEIIEKLAEMDDTFYQGGSMFFGCAHAESDWDFYMGYDPETVAALRDYGFKGTMPNGGSYIGDEGTNDRSGAYTYDVLELGNVHIQVIKHDVNVLRRARDLIVATRAEEHLKANKAERRVIWNAAITEVEEDDQWLGN